ncbi:MAG TPA: phosphotransferase [Candidatus Limnocylindria bacterium]|nr:phosphotransferase [Candidatus Limnocylindria bacterium]
MPLVDGGLAWFKACRPVQGFEPRLTADLGRRWPGLVTHVLAFDEERRWLLTADAGQPIEWSTEVLPRWLEMLPRYAELQIGEAARTADHLAHGVPDLRLETLDQRFEELVATDLPMEPDELRALRAFAPRFSAACMELAARHPVSTLQHDDLHGRSVHDDRGTLRVLDWGDAGIGHPLFSMVRLDLSLGETKGAPGRDRWFPRLRDAYLEPWGPSAPDLRGAFDLAQGLGRIVHTFTWLRHRTAMPAASRPDFDRLFAGVLRGALAAAVDLGV